MRGIAIAALALLVSLSATLAPHAMAGEDLVLNVTLDYDQERDNVSTKAVFNDLASYLSKAVGQRVKLIMTQNATRVGERVRSSSYSILLAPAQLVGLAMRHGYSPVARTEEEAHIVLVADKNSGITSLQTAKGKRIALPHEDSLVTYMLRGEMNAMGLSPSSYFGRVMHMTKYGAVLFAMEIGQADLIAAKDEIAQEMIKRSPNMQIVKNLPPVPLAGVVVSDKLDTAIKDKLRNAFTSLDGGLQSRLARAHFGTFEPADKPDFEYVSTRGFFSPEVLPGAMPVVAEQVKQLMAQKVPLFDVRPQTQYQEAHIPGAVSLPYIMNSPKEVDYDDTADRFDLSKLPQDKNAPMIFQCNGAECWYSYKAARYAVKRGYKKVYWFRTGLPAWKAAGYPIANGS